MGIELVTDATVEPISLALAWAHLKLDAEGSPLATADDVWLEEIGIPAAREIAEDFCGVAFAPKTYRLTLDQFPSAAIELKWPPLVSITSITYVDADGGTQTVDSADYTVDRSQQTPWVAPANDVPWPAALLVANSVNVTYVAGYAAADVPVKVKSAILLLLGNLYKNRESTTDRQTYVLPMGVESLLRPSRVKLGMA